MKHRMFSRQQPGKFAMQATGKTAEILVYDVIGEDWFGGLSAKQFVQDLAALGDVEQITVRINSIGGEVFEGVAIYNALKDHPATVTVQIDGIAASVASVIAMAGSKVVISPLAMIMIHNPAVMAFGEAPDLRRAADLLDKITESVAIPAYARTKLSPDELKAAMAAETWYSAEEAVAAGFADEITQAVASEPEARAGYDLSMFKHPPEALARLPEQEELQRGEQERLSAAALELVRVRQRKESLRAKSV